MPKYLIHYVHEVDTENRLWKDVDEQVEAETFMEARRMVRLKFIGRRMYILHQTLIEENTNKN